MNYTGMKVLLRNPRSVGPIREGNTVHYANIQRHYLFILHVPGPSLGKKRFLGPSELQMS